MGERLVKEAVMETTMAAVWVLQPSSQESETSGNTASAATSNSITSFENQSKRKRSEGEDTIHYEDSERDHNPKKKRAVDPNEHKEEFDLAKDSNNNNNNNN